MSQPFDATLTLELKRSPTGIALLTAMHGGAFIIVWSVPADALLRAGLMFFVLASFAHALMRHARLGVSWKSLPVWLRPNVVAALEWDRAGDWSVRYVGETQWHACVLRDRWLHPRLVILRLRSETDARAATVLLVVDAVASEPFRHLRARLQLQTAAV